MDATPTTPDQPTPTWNAPPWPVQHFHGWVHPNGFGRWPSCSLCMDDAPNTDA